MLFSKICPKLPDVPMFCTWIHCYENHKSQIKIKIKQPLDQTLRWQIRWQVSWNNCKLSMNVFSLLLSCGVPEWLICSSSAPDSDALFWDFSRVWWSIMFRWDTRWAQQITSERRPHRDLTMTTSEYEGLLWNTDAAKDHMHVKGWAQGQNPQKTRGHREMLQLQQDKLDFVLPLFRIKFKINIWNNLE